MTASFDRRALLAGGLAASHHEDAARTELDDPLADVKAVAFHAQEPRHEHPGRHGRERGSEDGFGVRGEVGGVHVMPLRASAPAAMRSPG